MKSSCLLDAHVKNLNTADTKLAQVLAKFSRSVYDGVLYVNVLLMMIKLANEHARYLTVLRKKTNRHSDGNKPENRLVQHQSLV